MATRKGLEPSTSSVTGWHSNRLNYRAIYEIGGNNRARTCDPLLVRQMLSQLSYAPELATPHRLNVSSAATRYIIHEHARFVNCFLKILQNKIKQGEITRIFPSAHYKRRVLFSTRPTIIPF